MSRTSQVVAELLAGRLLVEVGGPVLAPVEGDALLLDEREGLIDALFLDAAAAIDDPGLIDLVLGEAVFVQAAGAEIAVDHAHRGVAEHQMRMRRRRMSSATFRAKAEAPRRRARVAHLVFGIATCPPGAPLVEALHEHGVCCPVGRVGPEAGVLSAEASRGKHRC
jgi:hypothetical protein